MKTPDPDLGASWLLHCSYVRCQHGGSWGKGMEDLPVLSLELPVNL